MDYDARLIQPGVFRIMFTQFTTTSKPASPCQRMARMAFVLAAGQHVPAAQRLLDTWSAHALKPVNAIDSFDCANGHPGLMWRVMN